MKFSETEIRKALAIVRVFETGRPEGDYSALSVLDDGAGISYGIGQFTHRSGSLRAVAETYLTEGGAIGRTVIEDRLPRLRQKTKAAIENLAADRQLKKALRAAALTSEMRAAQDEVLRKAYMLPAIKACETAGFSLPLSLAVVYDSMVHGSWEKIRGRVAAGTSDERAWISEYVRLRDEWLESVPRLWKTRYRTKFFADQIKLGRWELNTPFVAHGVRLTAEMFAGTEPEQPELPLSEKDPMHEPGREPAENSAVIPPEPSDKTLSDPHGRAHAADHAEAETSRLDAVETSVNAAAAKYDRAERIVTTVIRRHDSAKSLWTTVLGSASQMAWAVAGAAAGVPREVWLAAAVISGALMLVYLYRQFVLGRIREQKSEVKQSG